MYSSHIRWLSLGLAVLAVACGDAPEFRFGRNITGIEFEFFDESEGVHPSKVTLENPRNPFREYSIGEDARFEILANGGNAGAFYAWATLLANIPIGENQFYTAAKLRDIYESGELAEEDRETVRQMAVDGFQAILDCFPDSLLFETTGTFAFRLATLAYEEIIGLGGVVEGDWVLVQDPNGDLEAVQSSSFSPGRQVDCL